MHTSEHRNSFSVNRGTEIRFASRLGLRQDTSFPEWTNALCVGRPISQLHDLPWNNRVCHLLGCGGSPRGWLMTAPRPATFVRLVRWNGARDSHSRRSRRTQRPMMQSQRSPVHSDIGNLKIKVTRSHTSTTPGMVPIRSVLTSQHGVRLCWRFPPNPGVLHSTPAIRGSSGVW